MDKDYIVFGVGFALFVVQAVQHALESRRWDRDRMEMAKLLHSRTLMEYEVAERRRNVAPKEPDPVKQVERQILQQEVHGNLSKFRGIK